MQHCESEKTANVGGEERVEADKIFYLFTVKKPDQHSLSQKIQVSVNSDVMLTVGTLAMMWWKLCYVTSVVYSQNT